MVADFALTLACGLAIVSILQSHQKIPLPFFRTQALIFMGLAILAAIDLGFGKAPGWQLGLAVAACAMGYLGSVCYGLGLPQFGRGALLAGGVSLMLGLAVPDYLGAGLGTWGVWNALSRWASAGLLGTTLTAMLLGHYYLRAPAMSVEPLNALVLMQAVALILRALLAGIMLIHVWSMSRGDLEPWFVAIRWGMGVIGVGVATWLAWNTARIRSTQSATGILYIAVTLVLFGELTSVILARQVGCLV
jgi:hypothetical protein